MSLSTKGQREFFLVGLEYSDGTFLGGGGSCTIVYICQNEELYSKRDTFKYVNYINKSGFKNKKRHVATSMGSV